MLRSHATATPEKLVNARRLMAKLEKLYKVRISDCDTKMSNCTHHRLVGWPALPSMRRTAALNGETTFGVCSWSFLVFNRHHPRYSLFCAWHVLHIIFVWCLPFYTRNTRLNADPTTRSWVHAGFPSPTPPSLPSRPRPRPRSAMTSKPSSACPTPRSSRPASTAPICSTK